jgi:hypothetical protein
MSIVWLPDRRSGIDLCTGSRGIDQRFPGEGDEEEAAREGKADAGWEKNVKLTRVRPMQAWLDRPVAKTVRG